MKNHQKKSKKETIIKNNVAKYAHHFNKAVVFKDRTKYQRKAKHKANDAFFIQLLKFYKKSIVDNIYVCFTLILKQPETHNV